MKLRWVGIATLLSLACIRGWAQRDKTLSVHVSPAVEIPLGTSLEYFTLGVSGELALEYGLRNAPLLFLGAVLDYSLNPFRAEESISVASGGAGGGVYLDLSPRFSVKGFCHGGYYHSFFNSAERTTGGNPYVCAGLGLSLLMTPTISLGLNAAYSNCFGLYQGIRSSLSTSYYLRGGERRRAVLQAATPVRPGDLKNPKTPEKGEGIEILGIRLDAVFPVFHKHYDDHPIGALELRNQTRGPISEISVSLLVKQYMDAPKVHRMDAELGAGEALSIDLYALFTDKILEITEGSKAAAEISLLYKAGGLWYRDARVETVRMYDRNAMSWDDDQKAAAFVTAKDPAVLNFSKNVVSVTQEQRGNSINENFLKAVALHEALCLLGVSYTVDPRTPYRQLSQQVAEVDFLQFPRQTLQYKAGDCDDLSILYCALLESVGIASAFITVPGHIFIALSLDLKDQEVGASIFNPDELVFREGGVWLPLEVTQRSGGFRAAWQSGARQWRENVLKDQAAFYPVHRAWERYEPVGLPGAAEGVIVPPLSDVSRAYQNTLSQFVEGAIRPKVAQLQEEMRARGASPNLHNKVGILYARHGLLDKAEAEFLRAVDQQPYKPALVNLGHLRYMQGRYEASLRYYEQARSQSPDDPQIILSLAQLHHRLEHYEQARSAYEQLKAISPHLAEKIAYVQSSAQAGTRAAQDERGVIEWLEQ